MQIPGAVKIGVMKIPHLPGFLRGRRAGTPDLVQNALMHRLALLPVILLVGLLAACGGASLASDPAQVLADAKAPPAGPNRSSLKIEFIPQGGAAPAGGDTTGADGIGALLGGALSGPITIEASSEGDVEAGFSSDGRITLSLAEIAVSARGDGSSTWVQIGDQWYALDGALPIDVAGLGANLGSVAPLVRDPKATAVEDVDGISCDRISGTLAPGADLTDQLGSLAENLPLDLAALRDGKAEVSIWVGRDDKTIHRVQVDTAGSGDADQTGALSIDFTVVPGEVVPVEAPAGAKPIADLLTQGLGDALGLGDLDLSQLLGGMTTGANA
jgi:hypothetical protein